MKKVMIILCCCCSISSNDHSDTASLQMQVNPKTNQYLDFSLDKSIATEGEVISFVNMSVGFNSYKWDFGDGTISDAVNVEHKYNLENDYIIRLTAENDKFIEKCVKVLTPNNRWAYLVNFNTNNIDRAYDESAFIVTSGGRVFRNASGIKEYYSGIKDTFNNVISLSTLGMKNERFSSSVKYEIGSFIINNTKVYKHLIIWRKIQGVFLRRFEIISPSDALFSNVDFLVERRIDWVKGSNSHNSKTFVAELYTKDAFYYLHSQNYLAIGNEAVAIAYNYMNNSSWSIESLTPYHCEPIQSNLVFEIGVYNGIGGTGEYVLVWRKDIDGIWRVLFDSNY